MTVKLAFIDVETTGVDPRVMGVLDTYFGD